MLWILAALAFGGSWRTVRAGQRELDPGGPLAPVPTPAAPLTGDAAKWGAASLLATPSGRLYSVKPGDTVWSISDHFGIGPDVLLGANPSTGWAIEAGEDLLIPYENEEGAATMGANGPVVRGSGYHFVASVEQQLCWLFSNGQLVQRWTCSTGSPESPSILGHYTIQTKMEQAYSFPLDAELPYWLGIYSAGDLENGIHGIPFDGESGSQTWDGEVGQPVTYGCIMLENPIAQVLFELADIGMPVTILQ
jgi:LysM repeat protein